MPAQKARTRSSEIECYEFKCQPIEDWPVWLSDKYGDVPRSRAGDFAVASYDTPTGDPAFWRWFSPHEFANQFEIVG
jgi:hypothetical protein